MPVETVPLFVPTPGGPELLIILFIAILLFGASKIPKLARSTGEAMGEFKKGREKAEAELEEFRKSGYEEPDDGSGKATAGKAEPVKTPESETDSEVETEADANPN